MTTIAVQVSSLTKDEFALFAKLVYKLAGIYLAPEKITLLSNRLRKRLRELKLSSFAEYHAKFSDASFVDEELPNFLSAVTTNETYFFRNERLWTTVKDRLLPEFVAAHSSGNRLIKIWSAASSSGEEAYSAAILLRETLKDFDKWRVTIMASDISKKVLDHARKGLYGEYAMAKLSPGQRKRWFTKCDDKFQLTDEIRKMVRFSSHDLRNPFPVGGFDFVLLRNVLMYFDTAMKLRAIDTACNALAPGGYLFVGDVDPIRTSSDLAPAMTLDRAGPGLYRKPRMSQAVADKRTGDS